MRSEIILNFEEFLKTEEKSKATIEKYVRDIRRFMLFSRNLIDKKTVLEYKEKLRDEAAVSSANSMIAAINCFLKFIGRGECCIKQFRIQRRIYRREDRELTKNEYKRLVYAADKSGNERLSLILQTICATGIRVSELQYITTEAVERGEAYVTCKGKSRIIWIPSKLQKKLEKYMREKDISDGAVFVTKKGRPVSRNNIWKEMKNLCSMANVEKRKVFPHNLRHLFARSFYNIDKDLSKLADLLGHSSIETTRIYITETGRRHRLKLETMRLIL